MTVLLTRPAGDNAAIAEALAARGIDSLEWPLTRIETTGAVIELPPGCRGLLATSGNGLRAFAANRPERDLVVLAVGDRTAVLAHELGFTSTESASGDARDLVRLATARGLTPLIHPRGEHQRLDLAKALAPHGIEVVAPVVYRAVPSGEMAENVRQALGTGQITAVTLWSPRNANIFKYLCDSDPRLQRHSIAIVAISDAAAEPLRRQGFGQIVVADEPNRHAMVAAAVAAHCAMRR